MLWKQKGFYNSSRSHVRYLRQWFSLSMSYVQLSQIDSPLQCHQRLTIPVVYTTRAGSKVLFQYQVIARERAVITGQIDPNATAKPGFGITLPSTDMCMDRDEYLINRELHMSSRDIRENGHFPKINYKEHGEWRVINHFGQVKLEFEKNRSYPRQRVHLKVNAFPGSTCSVTIVESIIPLISPAKIFDKMEELTHPRYGPNTHLYKNYDDDHCLEQVKSEGVTVNKSEEWRYTSLYVDSIEAFRVRFSLWA
ncbi:murinoglobulin-2 [Plakobranchus ocellatus]|uniref:Murinoglobulin-2 n=1 Tax=Plakobranchus ocellatus TaxID=259542 RepID=A0AAV4A850_9GAST|nr:murinoglobulin-2 [Plakobranchus ocellatus]